jgi:hypothetical protein
MLQSVEANQTKKKGVEAEEKLFIQGEKSII